MYRIAREFETAEEAIEAINALDSIGGKTTRRGKKPAKEEEPDNDEGDDLMGNSSEDEIDIEKIQELVKKLSKSGKKEKIQAQMEKFKCSAGISKLPEAKYGDFYAALEKIK